MSDVESSTHDAPASGGDELTIFTYGRNGRSVPLNDQTTDEDISLWVNGFSMELGTRIENKQPVLEWIATHRPNHPDIGTVEFLRTGVRVMAVQKYVLLRKRAVAMANASTRKIGEIVSLVRSGGGVSSLDVSMPELESPEDFDINDLLR